MKLFFQYQKQYSSVPVIRVSNPQINNIGNVLNPANLGSMFQRVKYSETCHSCHGVK